MIEERELTDHIESVTDEAKIARMWSAIRAGQGGRRVSYARVGAVLAVAAAALLAVWAWPRAEPLAGPLPDDAGAIAARWDAAQGPRRVRFADGSEVTLEAGAALASIDNDGERFVTLLERGRARFSVRPGGERRWVVESGLATVEVVGTVFSVERRADAVLVEVDRGVVVVRGERVPDRVVRLTRGQRLTVEEPALAVATPAPALPRVPAPEPEPAPEPARTPAPERPPTPAPAPPPSAEPVTGPAPVVVPDPPTPAPGVDPAVLDDLLRRAADARHRGDLDEASDLLDRASRQDDPRAALAAFTLGRMEMDQLQRPWRARRAFRRSLQLGLPERLAEQARRRLMQLGPTQP